LAALDDMEYIPPGVKLILHDSVMHNSVAAVEKLRARGVKSEIAIIHCLVNPERTVAIAKDYNNALWISEHIRSIGLSPQSLTIKDHDTLMAHSQAPLAILCQLLVPKLDSYAARGLLTPSAQALRSALENRASNWTEAALQTILSNPMLPDLLDEMREVIDANKV
jgi:hypothetical protein